MVKKTQAFYNKAMAKTILITGATGCVGHYTVELLQKQFPEAQLHLMVRNPDKFKGDLKNVHLHQVSFADVSDLDAQIDKLDCVILLATHWGSWNKCKLINVDQTKALCDWAIQKGCQQILYYSTASILDEQGSVMPKAFELGTSYVRSKYLAYQTLREQPYADKVYALFPTLVLGAESPYPVSHFSVGISQVQKYFNWLSKLKIDASFQFLHARDIAAVSIALIDHQTEKRDFILGNQALSFSKAIQILAHHLKKKIFFQLPISRAVIAKLLKLFRIQHSNWDAYCLDRGHFVFEQAVNPSIFGVETAYPTFRDVLIHDHKVS